MAEFAEVGPWAKEKLDALALYLDFYSKVLKNQPWRTIYLDAYAGGGRAVVRPDERPTESGPTLFSDEPPIDADVRELIDGSPRVAQLRDEYAGSRAIAVLRATAAEGIAWLASQKIERRTCLSFRPLRICRPGPIGASRFLTLWRCARLGERAAAGRYWPIRGRGQLRPEHGDPADATQLRRGARTLGRHARQLLRKPSVVRRGVPKPARRPLCGRRP